MSYALPPTPPPWVPAVLPDGTWIVRRDAAKIASVHTGEADARLLAAAHRLLRAAKDARSLIRSRRDVMASRRVYDGDADQALVDEIVEIDAVLRQLDLSIATAFGITHHDARCA